MMFIMGFACFVWQWSEEAYITNDGDDVMAMYHNLAFLRKLIYFLLLNRFFWPCISGVGQFIGVIALNNALAYPSTAVVNVIVASNSIIGLLLAYFTLGVVPTPAKLTGEIYVSSLRDLSSLRYVHCGDGGGPNNCVEARHASHS